MENTDVSKLPLYEPCRFVRCEVGDGQLFFVGESKYVCHRDLVRRILGIEIEMETAEVERLVKGDKRFKDMGTVNKLNDFVVVGSTSLELNFPSKTDLPEVRKVTMEEFRKQNPGTLFIERT